jgi:NAD-dependent dihydropyrimidine dehydrogenase PreA subunit
MSKRKIIKIDENKCNGCGLCLPNCPEGALQVIDGKVRLISDLFCDGLGACLGHCPLGAIEVIEREAENYDERRVMANIVKAGANVVAAHLNHLREHGEKAYLQQAMDYLKEQNIDIPKGENKMHSGCPGSQTIDFEGAASEAGSDHGKRASQLRQWPVQPHLVNPLAPYFQGRDVLLAADCVAYSVGDFHKDHLKGKSLAIACPKLDEGQETYIEKIAALIDDAKINTLTVMIMQVPCCGGLSHLAKEGRDKAKRKVPIKTVVVGLQGEALSENWE